MMKLIQYFLCITARCVKWEAFYRDRNKRQTKLTINNNNLIGSIFHHLWVRSFNRKSEQNKNIMRLKSLKNRTLILNEILLVLTKNVYYYANMEIYGNFQICISAPLTSWFMFGKKKTLHLKSSYVRYFKEKNHEIWNVNSNMACP